MATTTKNYGLTKPAGTDKYDIGVFNANVDKIDAQMKANANGVAANSTAIGNAIKDLSISGKVITYTKGNGTTGTITTQDTNTDTKNTAGSTDTSNKIYLIGATSQAANPQTYSHDTAYVGTDGKLYSGSKVVIASGDTATAANKLKTTRAIDGVNFNGEAAVTHYGTCATAAATATKAVSITNFTLVTGARVIVKFTVTNTAASPTLNVNNTGAKAIQYRGAAITAGYIAANRTYEFVYDGTNYQLVGDINTDTNTDTKVTQTNDTSTNASLPVLVSATADSTTERTGTVKYVNGKVYVNPSTGNLFATKFVGPLTGNVTGNCSGSSGSCTGNAATATKLQTARKIQTNLASTTAASFNGTANVTPGVTGILPVAHGGTGQSDLSNVAVGKATADASGNVISSTYMPKTGGTFTGGVTALNGINLKSDGTKAITFLNNSGTNQGYLSMSSGNIWFKSSEGSITFETPNGTVNAQTTPSTATGNEVATAGWVNNKLKKLVTISTSEPSGGSDGDIWFKYEA